MLKRRSLTLFPSKYWRGSPVYVGESFTTQMHFQEFTIDRSNERRGSDTTGVVHTENADISNFHDEGSSPDILQPLSKPYLIS